ncbi:hypothetical protein A3D72_00730 [Candidatus Uhrbacteria bacterium RIFCSPHIGHO2_02_FULL_57_19]|uniref:Uncharacterized protein n=2 Tax=Candidatus Uhriibacteriota TaxID=1752732 RepID=A0A1F7U6C4_9BACT|nr:MAG: hypothetical protein A3D72_00730 [Candidatus Uhrbacteria bacterium RIFCSPHIGHO2_02_FULL_57_19]
MARRGLLLAGHFFIRHILTIKEKSSILLLPIASKKGGCMGQFIATHTAFVEGGRKIGEKIAQLSSVEKVHAGPMTGRASHRPRIVLKSNDTTLEFVLGANDGHQSFFVHPREGVSMESLRRDVIEYCGTLSGYELSIPENGHETAPQDVAPKGRQEMVTVRYQFKLTLDEAERLIQAIDLWKGLPEELPSGAREQLGINLLTSLRNHGYFESRGYGRAASTTSDIGKFTATQFVVFNRQGKFKERFEEREEAC